MIYHILYVYSILYNKYLYSHNTYDIKIIIPTLLRAY